MEDYATSKYQYILDHPRRRRIKNYFSVGSIIRGEEGLKIISV